MKGTSTSLWRCLRQKLRPQSSHKILINSFCLHFGNEHLSRFFTAGSDLQSRSIWAETAISGTTDLEEGTEIQTFIHLLIDERSNNNFYLVDHREDRLVLGHPCCDYLDNCEPHTSNVGRKISVCIRHIWQAKSLTDYNYLENNLNLVLGTPSRNCWNVILEMKNNFWTFGRWNSCTITT